MIDAFIAYMTERWAIYCRRKAGQPFPWTQDPILRNWKFTNVSRELDRTTRWIRQWIAPHHGHPMVPTNLALARFICWPDTLAMLGFQHHWNPTVAARQLSERRRAGEKVWTGAYMVRSDAGWAKEDYVLQRVLDPMYHAGLFTPSWLLQQSSVEQVHARYCAAYGVQDFMAQEIIQDLAHTPPFANHWPDAQTFAAAGPGAQRGLNRVQGRPLTARVPQPVALREMQQLYHEVRARAELPLRSVHDVEFNLCEFDKYERVRTGAGQPRSRYIPSTT